MTDFIDQAYEAEGIFLEEALARFRQPENARESALHCWDCGEPIPEARRLAMRGCTLCIDCQEAAEKGLF